MAKPGRSTIKKNIVFDYPLPDDLKNKRVNLRWRASETGTQIEEVGFTGNVGEPPDLQLVEEWFDVKGGLDRAAAVMEESVIPRVRELFGEEGDLPPVVETPVEDGVLAPSTEALPVTGTRITIKGKKVKA